jgi:HPP family
MKPMPAANTKPDAPPPSAPKPKALAPEAKQQVAAYLGVLRPSLRELASALILVAERHERNYEIWGTATVLAGWIHEDDTSLDPFVERYGIHESDQPHKIRAALLGGVRGGLHGLLADLTDLSVLAEQVEMAWDVVYQGAKELEDEGLLEATGPARGHAERAIRWIRTQVHHTAPEALAVGADTSGSIAASLPKGPDRISAIPDPVWSPVVTGTLMLVVGALSLLVGRPWLLPSLGPSAVLAAEMPAHPVTRAWNTIVGHFGGLVAGAIGVILAGAATQPVVLVDHVLTPQRVLASVIAIALTVLVGALLRASHPPAAATTLLVSLGSLRTIDDAVNLMAGVLVLTAVAAVLRDVRMQRTAPGERMAPRDSYVRRFLRTRVG